MADEPEVQAQPDSGAEPASETPETASETTQETPVEAEGSDQSQADTESEPEIKSERGQKRVQDLANKAREAAEERDTLKKELETLTSPKSQQDNNVGGLPWNQQQPQMPELGSEVTPEQYWQHVEQIGTQKAEQLAELKVKALERKIQVKDNYDKDINELERNYSDAFESDDPVLRNQFKKAFSNYEKAIQVDPNVRFKDFAEPILQARSSGMETGKESAIEEVRKQVSEQAVQPGASSKDVPSSAEKLQEMMQNGEITAKEALQKYPDLLL